LLRVIAGLLQPDHGQCEIGAIGIDLPEDRTEENIIDQTFLKLEKRIRTANVQGA